MLLVASSRRDLVELEAFLLKFGARGGMRRHLRGEIKEVAGKEHNHMSTIYGVGSGDDEVEQWLVDILGWCLDGEA